MRNDLQHPNEFVCLSEDLWGVRVNIKCRIQKGFLGFLPFFAGFRRLFNLHRSFKSILLLTNPWSPAEIYIFKDPSAQF